METASSPKSLFCPACNARFVAGIFCTKDGTRLEPVARNTPPRNLVGQMIADRYLVKRLLGEGGMGQVYEAQHVHINKRFALKLLKPEIVANPDAVARFRQEAWSASSIGHENIVSIDDFATLADGTVYLVMEFLDGQSLSDRLRLIGRPTFDEILDVLIQVARGLQAAHEKGIVHRDIKPENIFIATRAGVERATVKILDFGIAKATNEESAQNLTRTGTIFGTPHYMSPEQALGKVLDSRSDIYSLGVIMYESFTGKVPFEAESFMGILTKHVTTPPKPPTQVAPDRALSPEIDAVVLKAMAKELPARYATMSELITDLEALRAHKPLVHARIGSDVDALMATMQHQVVEIAQQAKSPRNRIVFVLALVLLVGGVISWRALHQKNVVIKKLVAVTAAAPTTALAVDAPVSVAIQTVPPGANVFRDGKLLDRTPMAIPVESGKPVAITIKKKGYLDEAALLDGTKPKVALTLMAAKVETATNASPKADAHVAPKMEAHAVRAKPQEAKLPEVPAPQPQPQPKPKPQTEDPYEKLGR